MAQHTIKGVFSPSKDFNVVLLYKVTPTVSKYLSSAEINKDGHFAFELDTTATKGVYRLVYAIPQEDYNFDVIFNGKEDIELVFNSETGVKFVQSTENKLLVSYTNSMSMITQSIQNYYSSPQRDTTALKAIFKTQRETHSNYAQAAGESIALEFIKANKPYIPETPEPVNSYSDHLKKHYFDQVDFNNKILQSSSFLQEKMSSYVFGMSMDGLDDATNYKTNIDVVCLKMKDVSVEIKRILLLDLWQQLVDLNLESVANYLAEKYLMAIAIALDDQSLLHALTVYQNTSTGNISPDFYLQTTDNKTVDSQKLSTLNLAENYILLFWSSGCSHCLDEVPQLRTFINTLKKEDVKVIAIALENDLSTWENLIKDYPEFIHVYGKGKWDNTIANNYGVNYTPHYFVLDKNKVIKAKPQDLDALKALFEAKQVPKP